eukprot:TRINITY_DN31233_c0_g1_i1.p1 TRINITY_DN31233_c0_g1~~TRINITY_DN31233_c0_g1_i1.p1  ORF type:complete len:496 (+),score=114.48 TRINITY_DN31233_c0_g1_i1:59-1546(+)
MLPAAWLCVLLTSASSISTAFATQRRARGRFGGRNEQGGVTNLAPHVNGSTSTGLAPYKQKLKNSYDLQYTAMIAVGGQEMPAVLDSGSFELLVLSDQCRSCGDSNLYSEARSATLEKVGLQCEHRFGSGTTKSEEAYEEVHVGDEASLRSPKQHFWEVVDADMDILQDGFFRAILGVGPPRNAGTFAEENARMAMAYGEKGADTLQTVAEHTRAASSFLESTKVRSYSVCMGDEAGSPGYFTWNDDAAERLPTRFTSLKIQGDMYWATSMTKAQIGSPTSSRSSAATTEVKAPTSLGCEGGKLTCSAVFDTGSSLISAPREAIDSLQRVLDEWEDPVGDCSDLRGLPDLRFELDGKPFSLPPTAYAGKVSGEIGAALAALMPWLRQTDSGSKHHDCKILLLENENDGGLEQMWVLGMPFFRKYYVNFQLDEKADPSLIALAVADDSCEPAENVDSLLRKGRSGTSALRPLTLDAAHIRAPRRWRRRQRTPPNEK